MPGLVRKLIIFATVDGLVLQPLVHKGQKQPPAVTITYNGAAIGPALEDRNPHGQGFEAFGVVGLLAVSSSSYLISITRRKLVAHIHGKPIFVVTDVALTPISSRREAEKAIEHTRNSLQKRGTDKNLTDRSDSDDDEGDLSAAGSDDVDDEDAHPAGLSNGLIDSMIQGPGHVRRSSIAEDVMARKGGYGVFAHKWFSGKGWTVNQRRNLGMSNEDTDSTKDIPAGTVASTFGGEHQNTQSSEEPRKQAQPKGTVAAQERDVAATLLPKLLRTTRLLFGSSQSFFFSYDYDITRSVATQKHIRGSEAPLYKDVDPLFFWNRSVISPFIDAGQYQFVLPLMQGFIGQRAFTVDKHPYVPLQAEDALLSTMEMKEMSMDQPQRPLDKLSTSSYSDCSTDQTVSLPSSGGLDDLSRKEPHLTQVDETRSFLLTLISRRSIKRPGLRYLRRGVDEDGNTANSVETEQILSSADWSPTSNTYSFVQARGSIPLFFSQSPYSFKPTPQLQRSADANYRAIRKHFSNLSARYGAVQVASLVEKHGVEAHIGEEYEKNVAKLNESGGIDGGVVSFEWFDFHAMCRGMKFENVSILMESLGSVLDKFGTTVEADSKLISKQSGILRTNCMDCLDRTNVVQSACGRRALEIQLKDESIDLTLQTDQSTGWFNTLWADNGDAISKQYASTAALKGDFTRTRKRNYKGALTDVGLSISRFYSGIVNDYFSQAATDFLLGYVTVLVFEDFESNLMSADPAVSLRKVRQQAIETSQRLVVADEQEDLIGGWALLTPHETNTIKSSPFEESVMLLTDVALYACRFDWNVEKVSSFERVDLRHIVGVRYGTYITSTLSPAQADEKRNVGLIVTYKAGANDITRVNTRSMSTVPSRKTSELLEGTSAAAPVPLPGLLGAKSAPATRIIAFKVLPARTAAAESQDVPMLSEIEQVRHICAEIQRMALARGDVVVPELKEKNLIENADIISLAEARKSTGLLEQLGHSLKKLVWA